MGATADKFLFLQEKLAPAKNLPRSDCLNLELKKCMLKRQAAYFRSKKRQMSKILAWRFFALHGRLP